MMQAVRLGDGRLHLHHGPIDLIIDAEGPDRSAAFHRAQARFGSILDGLVAELPSLRSAALPGRRFRDPVAGRMQAAAESFLPEFLTPMAAVAGAVADEVLSAMTDAQRLGRAYVNNGGDIAFHLGSGREFRAAIAGGQGSVVDIRHEDRARGIATSGWRGRSHSLGIADAVTVVAATAAAADAAATLIANAVDLPGHPNIERVSARVLSPDSDLGDRLVTTGVGPLASAEIAQALDAGLQRAGTMMARGQILGAMLVLGPDQRQVGNLRPKLKEHA